MYIAHLTIEIALDGNDNLKAKRRVANSLKQKTRNKFNVAIAEDGTEDSLTLLRLAVVSISNSERHLRSKNGQMRAHDGGRGQRRSHRLTSGDLCS